MKNFIDNLPEDHSGVIRNGLLNIYNELKNGKAILIKDGRLPDAWYRVNFQGTIIPGLNPIEPSQLAETDRMASASSQVKILEAANPRGHSIDLGQNELWQKILGFIKKFNIDKKFIGRPSLFLMHEIYKIKNEDKEIYKYVFFFTLPLEIYHSMLKMHHKMSLRLSLFFSQHQSINKPAAVLEPLIADYLTLDDTNNIKYLAKRFYRAVSSAEPITASIASPLLAEAKNSDNKLKIS